MKNTIFLRFLFLIFIYSSSLEANEIKIYRDMVLIPDVIYYPLFKNDDIDSINVKSFYIDKYPVTNRNFESFLLENKEWKKSNVKSIFVDKNYLRHWEEKKFTFIIDDPVVNISWFAANEYCNYYGKRLPSIDEWEVVGSASKNNSIGKNDPNYFTEVLKWYTGEKTVFFRSKKNMEKNYWGIYGMNEGLWEWVEDFNSVIMINADAEGGELEEVLYCGAAATNSLDPSDYIAFMRFAFRNSLQADYTMSSLGFRCVKDVE